MLIAEVSERCNISTDTIRYYDRVGLIPGVQRLPTGVRNFTEDNCKWIEFIKCMRESGMPIEVLIEYVALFQQGDATISARKNLMTEQYQIMMKKSEKMQETLQRLKMKIEGYDHVVEKENELKKSINKI